MLFIQSLGLLLSLILSLNGVVSIFQKLYKSKNEKKDEKSSKTKFNKKQKIDYYLKRFQNLNLEYYKREYAYNKFNELLNNEIYYLNSKDFLSKKEIKILNYLLTLKEKEYEFR